MYHYDANPRLGYRTARMHHELIALTVSMLTLTTIASRKLTKLLRKNTTQMATVTGNKHSTKNRVTRPTITTACVGWNFIQTTMINESEITIAKRGINQERTAELSIDTFSNGISRSRRAISWKVICKPMATTESL